jgi:hypothetical protein
LHNYGTKSFWIYIPGPKIIFEIPKETISTSEEFNVFIKNAGYAYTTANCKIKIAKIFTAQTTVELIPDQEKQIPINLPSQLKSDEYSIHLIATENT